MGLVLGPSLVGRNFGLLHPGTQASTKGNHESGRRPPWGFAVGNPIVLLLFWRDEMLGPFGELNALTELGDELNA